MNGQSHPLDVPPSPRWVILPRDPPALVTWLRARQAENPQVYAPAPPEPPDEEDLS